jgi:hypothetical protein
MVGADVRRLGSGDPLRLAWSNRSCVAGDAVRLPRRRRAEARYAVSGARCVGNRASAAPGDLQRRPRCRNGSGAGCQAGGVPQSRRRVCRFAPSTDARKRQTGMHGCANQERANAPTMLGAIVHLSYTRDYYREHPGHLHRVDCRRRRCGAEGRLYDPQRPFTPRWLLRVVQQPLGRIASTPAVGQKRSSAPCHAGNSIQVRAVSAWCTIGPTRGPALSTFRETPCCSSPPGTNRCST